jgi:hypothetical protein
MLKLLTVRKVLLFTIFLALAFLLSPKNASAFSTPGGVSYFTQFEQAVYKTNEMNLQSFVLETVKATGASVVSGITGCLSCSSEEREKNPGLIGDTGSFIIAMYTNPPASGIQYLADVGHRLGLAKPAYAQTEGMGFKIMKPIQPIWKAFRNISYIFLALIFVVIGFAIMFRVKISPQAVVTIQSAIPRLVIVLILITFSYAIVGFLIDLMYVLIHLMMSVLRNIDFDMPILGQGSISSFIVSIEETLNINLSPGIQDAVLVILMVVTSLMTLLGLIILGPLGWIFIIIATITGLIALLRCAWTLLKAWAMVIVNLVFAPFMLLMGALPGSEMIGTWFRNTLASIMVLPVMLAMLFLSAYLIFQGVASFFNDWQSLLKTITFMIPGVRDISMTIDALTNQNIGNLQFLTRMLLPLIGLVILWMAPKVSDIIQSFIQKKPFAYGTAIGETIGAPGRIAAGTLSFAGGAAGSVLKIGEAWQKYGPKRGAGPPPAPPTPPIP